MLVYRLQGEVLHTLVFDKEELLTGAAILTNRRAVSSLSLEEGKSVLVDSDTGAVCNHERIEYQVSIIFNSSVLYSILFSCSVVTEEEELFPNLNNVFYGRN